MAQKKPPGPLHSCKGAGGF